MLTQILDVHVLTAGIIGGVLLRLRKQSLSRIPLPSIILSNAQSLRNKTDELQAHVRFQREFRDACLLAITETWLSGSDLDPELVIDGFGVPVRLDRDESVTGMSQGEFPQIFVTVVYIHPRANADKASESILKVTQKLQEISPEAPVFVLGDFNHCSLKKCLRDFSQYVTCPTRQNKSLDLCYGSIKGAYKALPLPPLGGADHNCVQEIRSEIRRAKQGYKEKIEKDFGGRNLRSAWDGMKTVIGTRREKKAKVVLEGFNCDSLLATELNKFYLRFDTSNFRNVILEQKSHLHGNSFVPFFDEQAVVNMFKHSRTGKSPGPDNIGSRLLISCAEQLGAIFHYIFQLSLEKQRVPNIWKQSIVIPVAKQNHPKVLNDFRPVALILLSYEVF
ncbi:hypothetical protein PO909_000083 [Leuciscus waleckii]